MSAGPAATLLRRCVTFSLYPTLLFLLTFALPALVPLTLVVDALRARSSVSRALLFLWWYLLCEFLGLLAALAMLLCRPLLSDTRWTDWHYGLQGFWGSSLFAGARTLFGLVLDETDLEPLGPGPILLFVRHASIADTLLASVLLQHRGGWRLRYVLKRELLWDPCLDVVGQRLPNYFVDRGGTDSAREIAGVRALTEGLGPGEGVLIYPEGTRFSRAKRARILSRLAESDPARHARVEPLEHTLPPRLGGTLALIDARPDLDVAFLVHQGFEGSAKPRDVLDGKLVGAEIRIALWRIPAEQIPQSRSGQIEWLDGLWRRVDGWIGRPSAADS